MVKTDIIRNSPGRMLSIHILMFLATCMACSKPSEDVIPIVQQPPTVSPPSGEIQNFVMNDTLVAFNAGSTAKWLVTGTNNQSLVTFNGVKVPFYGNLETGPLRKTTIYTLAINNGKKALLTLKVADSITALLWHKGKRWKLTKVEVYIVPAGQKDPIWVDTTIKAQVADQRIFFNLDGSSKIIQATSSLYVSAPDGGKFVVNETQTEFTWQGFVFTIQTLDNAYLVVTYNPPQPIGPRLLTRNTYEPE